MSLDELIEKLEKATGPDRHLDHLIHSIVVAPFLYDHIMWPAYTASTDAALKLVPGHVWPRLQAYDEGVFGAHVWLYGPSGPVMSDSIVWGEAHIKPLKSTEYTDATKLYPLAICIAALKAMRKPT